MRGINKSASVIMLDIVRFCYLKAREFILPFSTQNLFSEFSQSQTQSFEKELVHAFSCVYIELRMQTESLESTQEARVARGDYASIVLSKRPACIHTSICAR